MKNIFYLIIATALISSTACKKFRTCECTYTNSVDGIVASSVKESEISTLKMSKKDGKTWCKQYNSSLDYLDVDDDFNVVAASYVVDCELF